MNVAEIESTLHRISSCLGLFAPTFPLLVRPRSDDWHQAENSHLVPVNASEYWNPHLEFCSATFKTLAVCCRLFSCVSNRGKKTYKSKNEPAEHQQLPGSLLAEIRSD